MFAVIKTGGKQYRVAAGDTITVEKLAGEPGEIIAFEQVLMLVNGAATEIGAPSVAGVTVAGELVEQTRGAKVIAFKKRRRKNSRRKRGHRQEFTLLRITEILTDGKKPSKTAQPRPKRAPKPAPAAEETPAKAASETTAKAADAAAKKRKSSANKAPAKKADKPKAKAPPAKAKKPAPKGKKK
jgi:large subunit ribosomal protein L21